MSAKYFATEESEKTANELLRRAENWFNVIESSGFSEKLENCWAQYHGVSFDSFSESHKINFAGEQGELTHLPVNHMRNITKYITTMITSNRPKLDARAMNSDYKSLAQTKLAKGILDYYMREKNVESYFKYAIEYAMVLTAGYIKMDWDATAGDVVDYDEETGEPYYLGDIVFTNLNPYDVFFDPNKETNQDHSWVLTRTFKNKFDLAAKYPEMEEQILNLPTKSEMNRFRLDAMIHSETEDIPVYEFYHKRTNSVPDGRYLQFLDSDVVLMDGPMPYKNLPVYKMSAGDILGTPFGYTQLFDLMPLQDAINVLYSAVFTNNNAFGVQNIISPRGSEIDFTQIGGSMNFIEYNHTVGGKPEALQLTQSSPETYKLIEMLERNLETVSGVNSVMRGNPEASLRSASALALVQSMALQYMSDLQNNYIRMMEDVGTGIIDMLKDFGAEPRVITIAGERNKSHVEHFTRDDLGSVGRVFVDVGNPIAATYAGRAQIADQLLQYQLLKDPRDYLLLLETGSLESLTESDVSEQFLIKDENEELMNGRPVKATAIDDHVRHITGHRSVISDRSVRQNPEIVAAVLAHITEHIEALKTTDPQLLQLINQPPLEDPQQQQQATPGAAPESASGVIDQPLAATNDPAAALGIEQPATAQPPEPFQDNEVFPEGVDPRTRGR